MPDSIIDRLRAAGLIQTTEAPVGTSAPSNMRPDRASAYAAAALAGECDNVRSAVEGTRNDTVNRAAWKVGRLVAAGQLDADQAFAALTDAARATGLPSGEAGRTIRHALGDGQAKQYQPASASPLDDEPLIEEVQAESLRGKRILSPGGSQPVEVKDEDQFEEDPAPPGEVTDEDIDSRWPIIDWHELWSRPKVDDYIIEPILRRGKAIVLYSPPKVGKSLLTLEIAGGVASGREVLGTKCEPRVVLYVDYENDPEDDVRERLQDMGYGPDDLGNLRYLPFPDLAALDSPTGGKQVYAIAKRHKADVVIVDTLSRAVEGKENENDTYLALYRHAVLPLKKAGIAFMRLDHSGKDVDKGMRGASAKSSDVDAVWKLTVVDADAEILELECTDSRKRLDQRKLTLRRVDVPRLSHLVDGANPFDVKVQELIATLERLGVARTAGRDVCRAALKRAGQRVSNQVLLEAVRARKAVEPLWTDDHEETP